MSKSNKDDTLSNAQQSEDTYLSIRGYVIDAQKQIYSAVNSAMVTAYWEIGRLIYETCGESERAAYGKQILQYVSERLTSEFGKGFSVQGLRNMRQFYLAYPKRSTLWSAKTNQYDVLSENTVKQG